MTRTLAIDDLLKLAPQRAPFEEAFIDVTDNELECDGRVVTERTEVAA